MIKKIIDFIKLYKKMSIGTAVVIIIVLWRVFSGGATAATSYTLVAAAKGTLITSVSGSGQVSTTNQVDVKSKVSGDVVYINVKNGQEVRTGALLVQLDARDASKALRDAQINLESAQISLAKLQLSQQSNIPQLQDSLTTTTNNLAQAYQNAYNDISNAFLDLPNILDGVRGVLYDETIKGGCSPNKCQYTNLMSNENEFVIGALIQKADADYLAAKTAYDATFAQYKSITRDASVDTIVALVKDTQETTQLLSQTSKSEQNMLDSLVADINDQNTKQRGSTTVPAQVTSYQANISTYIGKLNSHISTLSSIQNSITAYKQALASTQRQVDTTQKSDPLDITSQQNTLKQRQASLQDARDTLGKYYIRAPFDGIIAKVLVQKGDSAGSTGAVTMIAKQKIAEIALNEVDVAKVSVGQKVTLTFDAVQDLTIAGGVLEIDALGTVSQGVVTYNVKIGFDTQDDRIKPGMSVSAAIITLAKTDVLLIPNSAIKTQGNTYYVQVPNEKETVSTGALLATAPRQQIVEVGLTNDSLTEIISGLAEGDIVVSRTTTTTAAAPATQGQSLFSTGRNAGGASGAGAPRGATGR